MWEPLLLLLLPLGLGAALETPGAGDPSGGCGSCHSSHGGRAVTNATLGANVTLGCPAAGAPLGRVLAVRWHFRGDPALPAVPVCVRGRGPPRCHPPYGDRATLVAPDGPLGSLVLRDVRGGDSGTFTCLLVGDSDCACGTVTLRLRAGVPCSPPCSGTPPRGGRGIVIIVTVAVAVTALLLLPPARGR